MVYTQLWIVYGVELDAKEVFSIFAPEKTELDEDEQLNELCTKMHKDVEAFRFPCCSDSSNKKIILGVKMHTYYRKYIRCDNCETHSVCDTCIGNTNNGLYDVDKIFSDSAKCNPRHICQNCNADNKIDLGGKLVTEPLVNGKHVEEKNNGCIKCSTCNSTPSKFVSPMDAHKSRLSHFNREIAKLLKKGKISKEFYFYYMIDDCLSC